MIAWLCPHFHGDASEAPKAQVIAALEMVCGMDDAEALRQVMEAESETLFSDYALVVLYLTALKAGCEEDEETAQKLGFYLGLLYNARLHGIAQSYQYLLELQEHPNSQAHIPISPSAWLTLFTQARSMLTAEQYPLIFVNVCLEISEVQEHLFDETHDEHWLLQATTNYGDALACCPKAAYPVLWGYLHMRRGIVSLRHQQGGQAEAVEQAIADLEATLTVISPVQEPLLWCQVHKNLGLAYEGRFYEPHNKNLQQAADAYRAALEACPLEEMPDDYIEIQHHLTNVSIELRQERQARDAFAALLTAARYLEQVALEQVALEQLAAEPEARVATRRETPQHHVVAVVVEEWLAITSGEQLYAFLVEHQDILVSHEALAVLKDQLNSPEESGQEGRAEHISLLIRLIENALNFSLEVAWQRYRIEILPVVEAVLLLSTAPSFTSVQQRMAEQQELFTSPTMLAVLYLMAQSADNTIELDQILGAIRGLKYARSNPLPPPVQNTTFSAQPGMQEDEAAFAFSPRDFGGINLRDPYFMYLVQEVRQLSQQQATMFLPYFMQVFQAISETRFSGMGEIADQMLEHVDRQKTPYLWATFHWGCIAGIITDPSGNFAQGRVHCEAALAVFTREAVPNIWALLMLTRAVIAWLDFDNSQQRELLQEVLRDLEAADSVYAQQGQSLVWALLRIIHGVALVEQQELDGQNRATIESIIADFDKAEPLIIREGSTWHRIWLSTYRARAIYLSQGQDRRSDMERVIEDCDLTIILCQPRTSTMMAQFWARALLMRGKAYMERLVGVPGDNIEQALEDFEQALTILTRADFAVDWAIVQANCGNAFMLRIAGEKQQNLQRALEFFQQAITVLEEQQRTMQVGTVLLNRSLCYMQCVVADRGQYQRLALEDCNEALRLFPDERCRNERATALANRATIYMQLLSGDRRHNWQMALEDCNAALSIFSLAETPLLWAKTRVNRGIVYRSLALMMGYAQRGSGMRTALQRLLGQHQESASNLLAENAALFEQALVDFSAALTVLTRELAPREWAATLRERALVYVSQASACFGEKREEYLRRGIADYDAALAVFSRYETPYDWAITRSNRAFLYSELATKVRIYDAEHALADTEEAMEVLTRQVAPSNFCRLQYIRAGVFAKLEQWSQVHMALSVAREVLRDLVADAVSGQDQTDSIAEFALADVYLQDAWAMLHIQPVDEMAIALVLEEGRAQSLRAALELDKIQLEHIASPQAREHMKAFISARNRWRKARIQALQHQATVEDQRAIQAAHRAFVEARAEIRRHDDADFMAPAPTRESLAHALAAPDEALVYLVAGSLLAGVDGMAMVLTRDEDGCVHPHYTHLPNLQEISLFDLLEIEQNKAPIVRIAEAIATLGQAGLQEVAEWLLRTGVRKVRLVPYSWLGLFPLGAALISVGERKRHLQELFEEVTIVPGARSLEVSSLRVRRYAQLRRVLLLAGNPKPHQPGAGLPYAEAEAATICHIASEHGYPAAHIHYLRPREITRERVIEKLAEASYAHLAVHGSYHVGEPRRSRLILADVEPMAENERSIRLGEVLDDVIKIKKLRLLVLSACETSIIDMQRVPNEALGIAVGFLQAGAAAVIASLWPVDDRATYLLMTRFAQLYLDMQGVWSPARALVAAQCWLREEATNRVLADYDPSLVTETGLRSLHLDYESARFTIQLAARQAEPDALPYANPFFWAGFVVIGV